MRVTVWHNPACGTSRTVLALLREREVEPEVIEYLKTPPTEEELRRVLADAGMTPRELLRAKEPQAAELGLNDPAAPQERIIEAMLAHPLLINRPVVRTAKGVRLCRPSEKVLELL